MLVKVILVNKIPMFYRLNKDNDPFRYILIEGIMVHLDTYQWMEVHIFWPFWIPKTFKIHLNGFCNFQSWPILVGTWYVLTITWDPQPIMTIIDKVAQKCIWCCVQVQRCVTAPYSVVKWCSGAWMCGQDIHVGMFSLYARTLWFYSLYRY